MQSNSIGAMGMRSTWLHTEWCPPNSNRVLNNEPLDMDYESIDNEERYRAVGLTSGGRLLSVVLTVRDGRLRAVTAFPAGAADAKAFPERTR